MKEPSNYRPISLLSTILKVVEKLVKRRMMDFLSQHSVFSSSQFGFLMKQLFTNYNNGQATAAVFCDFSKAFDCVNRRVLLQKLEIYGFRGLALRWFESYLSLRVQCVSANGKYSTDHSIEHGVPLKALCWDQSYFFYISMTCFVSIYLESSPPLLMALL